jgi:hypothetical protein
LSSLSICGSKPLLLCGNFTVDIPIPGLVAPNGSVEFQCKLPAQYDQPDRSKGVAWEICFLDDIYGGLISSLDPTNNQSLKHNWEPGLNFTSNPSTRFQQYGNWVADNGISQWGISLGQGYIIMNASSPLPTPSEGQLSFSSTKTGAWTQVEFSSNSSNPPEQFHMSICYDSL